MALPVSKSHAQRLELRGDFVGPGFAPASPAIRCGRQEYAIYKIRRRCAEVIPLNFALVPRKAKWRLRYLDYKEIKDSVRRQTRYRNVHNFDWVDVFDFHAPMRAWQKGGERRVKSWVAHHVEFEYRTGWLAGNSWRRCHDSDRHSEESHACKVRLESLVRRGIELEAVEQRTVAW